MIDYSWCCNAFLWNPKVDARSYKRSVFCFTKKFFCIYLLFTSLLPLLYPELIYLIFLMQVGYVTTICFSCFLIRCVMVSPLFFKNLSDSCCMVLKLSLIILCQMCFNAFDKAADLDVLYHPILNFMYYLVSLYFFIAVLFFAIQLLLIVVVFKLAFLYFGLCM